MATVKVAAVQAAYTLMDQKACLASSVDLLARAAGDGATIYNTTLYLGPDGSLLGSTAS